MKSLQIDNTRKKKEKHMAIQYGWFETIRRIEKQREREFLTTREM